MLLIKKSIGFLRLWQPKSEVRLDRNGNLLMPQKILASSDELSIEDAITRGWESSPCKSSDGADAVDIRWYNQIDEYNIKLKLFKLNNSFLYVIHDLFTTIVYFNKSHQFLNYIKIH